MVLSVAIIVLLIALLLPSLSGVRRRAWDTKSISNLRQHSLVFGAYASDHAGYFPFFTDPDATWTVLRAGEESVVVPYFGASPYWKYALAPTYYQRSVFDPVFYTPGPGGGAYYRYASCAIARPEFWREETRTGPEQWGPVLVAATSFPAQKGQLWAPRENGEEEVGFIDGHAEAFGPGELRRGYRGGEGGWPGSLDRSGNPVLHTIGGVRGRDVP